MLSVTIAVAEECHLPLLVYSENVMFTAKWHLFFTLFGTQGRLVTQGWLATSESRSAPISLK